MSDSSKYEFNLSDPDSWSKMPKPLLPESFVKETAKVGGLNAHGQPRFKWVWGMSEEVYVEADAGDHFESGWYLKYQLCDNRKTVGYKWNDETGERRCEQLKDVPMKALSVPITKIEQIGTPRWILEEWHEAGDCNGIYDAPGYYFHRKIIADDAPENPETFLKPYREPNAKDLEILAGYVKATATLTEKEITEGVERERAAEAKATEDVREELREDIAETLVSTITAMPRLPRPSDRVIQDAWRKLEGI